MNNAYTVETHNRSVHEFAVNTPLGVYYFNSDVCTHRVIMSNNNPFPTQEEIGSDWELASDVALDYLFKLSADHMWYSNRLNEVLELLSDENIASWERSLED
jgi:type VI protein secretion system component VasA